MKTITRISKKNQHINSIRFDMDYMQEVIADNKPFFFWYGERHSLQFAKNTLAELTEELNKIFADKTYKPWKENDKI